MPPNSPRIDISPSQETIPPVEPCTLVIFGGSGDLARRRLIPALYNLLLDGLLPPNYAVVGLGRTSMTDEEFRATLRDGVDLVVGNRFLGGIEPGAMPWSHRWIGNPVLTFISRVFFHTPVGDAHCGLRGFRKEAFQRMKLRATGMEFASEMVIKASLKGMRIAEVPVALRPDGRSRAPHLRTWRDGWRHLRFMLLFSPRWLFLYPGAALFGVGLLAGAALEIGPVKIGPFGFDISTLLLAGFCCLIGYQLVVFAVFTKVFSLNRGSAPAA